MDIQRLFTYHAPSPEQMQQLQEIRGAAKLLAEIIVRNTPDCADRYAAIRHLREAVMTANAAVVIPKDV